MVLMLTQLESNASCVGLPCYENSNYHPPFTLIEQFGSHCSSLVWSHLGLTKLPCSSSYDAKYILTSANQWPIMML